MKINTTIKLLAGLGIAGIGGYYLYNYLMKDDQSVPDDTQVPDGKPDVKLITGNPSIPDIKIPVISPAKYKIDFSKIMKASKSFQAVDDNFIPFVKGGGTQMGGFEIGKNIGVIIGVKKAPTQNGGNMDWMYKILLPSSFFLYDKNGKSKNYFYAYENQITA